MPRFKEKLDMTEKNLITKKHSYNPSDGITNCAMYSYSKTAEEPVCYYNTKKKHKSPKFEFLTRKLDYCIMFVFNEGNFGFIFDDISFHPTPGDVVVIKNDITFSSFFPEKSYIDYHEISFPMSFFEHFRDDSIFHRLFFNDMETGAKIISPNKISSSAILQKFNEIDNVIKSESVDSDIISFSYIAQIIAIICSQENNNLDDIHMEFVHPKLKLAVNYINENFTEPITVADASNYCNISNTYLARLFKKVYKSTPHEYLTNLRITYSKSLLVQGQSITDACFNSGFTDYNNFITKFKSVTGTTPYKYKKSKS